MYPQPKRPPQLTRSEFCYCARRHGESAEEQVANILGDQLDAAARRALLQRAGGDANNAIHLFFDSDEDEQIEEPAPAWKAVEGARCEARYMAHLPSFQRPSGWWRGRVCTAHDDGTFAVKSYTTAVMTARYTRLTC